MTIDIYNEKIMLLLSFSMGLFINIGSIYLCIILLISNFNKIINANSSYNKYSDYILAFLAGVIIHHIYIPLLLLSIIMGALLNEKLGAIDVTYVKNKINNIKDLLKDAIQ